MLFAIGICRLDERHPQFDLFKFSSNDRPCHFWSLHTQKEVKRTSKHHVTWVGDTPIHLTLL